MELEIFVNVTNLHLKTAYLSNNQSTAKIMVTSSAGSPTVSNTITIVTNPACGIPAAPILAAVAVMEIAATSPIDIVFSLTCAMKMAAIASYNAVPSILIVAPIGKTNLINRKIQIVLTFRIINVIFLERIACIVCIETL